MGLHPYLFEREDGGQAARIRVNESVILHVHIGDKYRERFPKPGKAPRVLTVTIIFPPSNDNSGTASIAGTTERTGAGVYLQPGAKKGGTSVMAYTLHSHWEKV